jgi:predicted RNA binding protein YcfA (HicA-like mRNA interferase family)
MNWYKTIKISQHLKPYGALEFTRILKKYFNVEFIRYGKGNHQIWGIPETGFIATIPMGTNQKKIQPGTVQQILKELHIPLFNFNNKKPLSFSIENIEDIEVPEWKLQPWHKKQLEYSNKY